MADDIVDPFDNSSSTPSAIVDPFDTSAPKKDEFSRLGEAASMVTDILPKIGEDASKGLEAVNRGLNPWSESYQKAQKEEQDAGFFGGMAKRLGRTGSAIAGAAEIPAALLTGPVKSILGHGFDAIAPHASPELQEKLKKEGVNVPTGDEFAEDALSAVMPGRGRIVPKLPDLPKLPAKQGNWFTRDIPDTKPALTWEPNPPKGPAPTPPKPDEFLLSEGEKTGDLATIQKEQAALRGTEGEPAQERAKAFFEEQRPAQLEQEQERVQRAINPDAADTLKDPLQAAETASEALRDEERLRSGASAQEEARIRALVPSVKPYEAAATVAEALGDQNAAQAAARTNQAQRLNEAGEALHRSVAHDNQIHADTPLEAADQVSNWVSRLSDQAQEATRNAYQALRELPGRFHPASFNMAVRDITRRLPLGPANQQIHMDPQRYPIGQRLLNDLSSIIQDVRQSRDDAGRILPLERPLTPQVVEEVRQRLNTYMGDAMDSARRDPSGWKDVNAVGKIISEFDRFVINKLGQPGAFTGGDASAVLDAMREARRLHSDYRRNFTPQGSGDKVGSVIQNIIGRHEGQEASAGTIQSAMFSGNNAPLVARRFRDVFGQRAPELWSALKQGYLRHIMTPPEGVTWTPEQQSKRIYDALGPKGTPVTREYLTPDEIAAVRRHAEMLRESAQPVRPNEKLTRLLEESPNRTGSDFQKDLFGSSGVGESAKGVQIAKHIEDTYGRNSPQFEAVRQGQLSSLFRTAEGPGGFDPAAIAADIREYVSGKGRAMAESLHSEKERDALSRYADRLDAFAESQKLPKDPVENAIARITGRNGGEPLSTAEVRDLLWGRAGAKDKAVSLGVAKRLKQILPPEKFAELGEALFRRMLEPGGDKEWGPARVADKINQFLRVDGKELADVMYTPEAKEAIGAYGDLMRKITVPQKGANWSNTGNVTNKDARKAMVGLAATLGGIIGHFIHVPEIVGAGAGAGAGWLINKGIDLRSLRQVSKQLPLVAEQAVKYQKALERYNKTPTPMGKAAIVTSTAALNRALVPFGTTVEKAMQSGISLPGTGRTEEDNKKRAAGGSVGRADTAWEPDGYRDPPLGGPSFQADNWKDFRRSENIDDRRREPRAYASREWQQQYYADPLKQWDELIPGVPTDKTPLDRDQLRELSRYMDQLGDTEEPNDTPLSNALGGRYLPRRAEGGAVDETPFDPMTGLPIGVQPPPEGTPVEEPSPTSVHANQLLRRAFGNDLDTYLPGEAPFAGVIPFLQNKDANLQNPLRVHEWLTRPLEKTAQAIRTARRVGNALGESIESGATAAGDTQQGKVARWEMDPETGEFRTSPELIQKSMDMAGLAGSGGVGAGISETAARLPGRDMRLLGRSLEKEAPAPRVEPTFDTAPALRSDTADTGKAVAVAGREMPPLRVAAKIGDKVYEGKPGEIHAELLERYPAIEASVKREMDLDDAMGFVEPDGKFLSRGEAANKYATLNKNPDEDLLLTDNAPDLWSPGSANRQNYMRETGTLPPDVRLVDRGDGYYFAQNTTTHKTAVERSPRDAIRAVTARSDTADTGKAVAAAGNADRLARARAQGFNTDETLYHGTSKDTDFKKFKDSRHGTWTTTDPKLASEYAMQNDSQGHTFDGRNFVPTNTASRVIPLHAKPLQNPYVVKDFPDSVIRAQNYKKAQSDWFDQLKRAGHDGVIMPGGVRVDFDNANLRSPFAKFDPKNAGKSGLLLSDSQKPGLALSAAERARQQRATDQGYTLDAYHGTRAKEFDSFKTRRGDIGIHFGDSTQANARAGVDFHMTASGNEVPRNGPERVVPTKLKLKNPLRLYDRYDWYPSDVLNDLAQITKDGERVFSADEINKVRKKMGSGEAAKPVQDLIKSKGYDGIVYKNEFEGDPYSSDYHKTTGDSYIVFDPEQVRSQFAKFDPKNVGKAGLLLSDSQKPGFVMSAAKPLSNEQLDSFYPKWDAIPKQYRDTAKSAMQAWVGIGYDRINHALRYGKGPMDWAYGKYQREIRGLDRAFDYAAHKVDEPIQVYRGVNSDMAFNFKPGDEFRDLGFVSTTNNQKIAKQFAEGEDTPGSGTMFEITIPKGTKVLSPGSNFEASTAEPELLLKRGTYFKVTGVEGNTIKLEVVAKSDTKNTIALDGSDRKKDQVPGPETKEPDTREQKQPPARARGGRVVASNINHNPSEKQKETGNYAKDRVHLFGMELMIENVKGSKRNGVGKDGTPWEATVPWHYGYVSSINGIRPLGADGDKVDVFLGPHTNSKRVFVIDQVDPETKKFDEVKAFLGAGNAAQARHVYMKAFTDGKAKQRIGAIHSLSLDEFKEWLRSGDTTKRFSLAS